MNAPRRRNLFPSTVDEAVWTMLLLEIVKASGDDPDFVGDELKIVSFLKKAWKPVRKILDEKLSGVIDFAKKKFLGGKVTEAVFREKDVLEAIEGNWDKRLPRIMDSVRAAYKKGALDEIRAMELTAQSLAEQLTYYNSVQVWRDVAPGVLKKLKLMPDASETATRTLISEVDAIMQREGYFSTLGNMAASRSYHFGMVDRMMANGVMTYAIVTIPDERRCPICGALHGVQFDVPFMLELQNQFLAEKDVESAARILPFPSLAEVENASREALSKSPYFPPFHPRSYSEDSEVYTSDGWKFFRDLRGDELFLSPNPENNMQLEWVGATRLVSYNPGNTMTRLRSQNFSLVVTNDHDQIYSTSPWNKTKRWKVEQISNLSQKAKFFIPRCARWIGNDTNTVQIGQTNIPIDIYAEFMAYWLSDGSVIEKGPDSYYITISNQKSQDRILRCVRQLPISALSYKRKTKIEFNHTSIGMHLKQFGHSHNKYVPQVIKNARAETIKVFLESYLVCDGHVSRSYGQFSRNDGSENKVFYTTSNQMASDIGELILKVGGYPNYILQEQSGRESSTYGHPMTSRADCWRIYWNKSKTATFGYNGKGSIDVIQYRGMAYCVELEKNHILWIRHNGKTCFSGNCRCTIAPVGAKTEQKPMSAIGRFVNCIISKKAEDKPDPCRDYTREGSGKTAKWVLGGEEVKDKKILKRLNGMRIPPAWDNVVVATDKNLKIQAMGQDKAGRWQYRYSEKHIEKAAKKKFDRIKLFSRAIDKMREKAAKDIAKGRAEAFLFRMEDKSAIRAGSDTDFRAKKKAYGLTTLQHEHAQVKGDIIILDFVAKEGKDAHYEIADSTLAKWLKKRIAETKEGEKLFPDVTASKLNAYIKSLPGGKKFSIKDFRTYHGTRRAYEILKDYAGKDLSKKEKKELVKKVCVNVSDFLHNTPAMAKNSYIDPTVWEIIGGLE